MNKELDDLLCKKYPKIFSERNLPMTETCMCWGFCCENGWFDLIDNLCYLIQKRVDEKELEQVVASQVKEKYGGLRFYVKGGDEITDSYIVFAETMSHKICEVCGDTGQIRNRNNWWSTTCDTHHQEQIHKGHTKE